VQLGFSSPSMITAQAQHPPNRHGANTSPSLGNLETTYPKDSRASRTVMHSGTSAKSLSTFTRIIFLCLLSYSRSLASKGQAATHAPQPMHCAVPRQNMCVLQKPQLRHESNLFETYVLMESSSASFSGYVICEQCLKIADVHSKVS